MQLEKEYSMPCCYRESEGVDAEAEVFRRIQGCARNTGARARGMKLSPGLKLWFR